MGIQYIKADCYECGNPIEYPQYGAKEEVPCPHCGQTILLEDCLPDMSGKIRISPHYNRYSLCDEIFRLRNEITQLQSCQSQNHQVNRISSNENAFTEVMYYTGLMVTALALVSAMFGN